MLTKFTLIAFVFYCAFTCVAAIALLVVWIGGPLAADDPWMMYLVHSNLRVVTWGVFIASVLATLLLRRRKL